jgi:UDP-GlcNAc:undecaprenyl-phosphate/decaprenyl-phosphate GlcNAc-1-phosphate transferase
MIEISLIIFNFFIIFLINKFRIRIASFINLFDRPDKIRKFHKEDTPILGGIMIFIPFFLTSLYLFFFQNLDKIILIILCACTCCFVIGLIDDLKTIAYKYKFFFLIIFFYLFIYQDPNLQINKLYFSSFDKIYSLNSFGVHFTVLCLLLLTNSLNLIDGIDGLCILTSLLILNWLMFIFSNFTIINIVLAISLVYVFILNLKKNIFLGDSGSLFIGSIIGLNLIYNYNLQSIDGFLPAENIFIALMLPGLDMLRVFAIRIKNKKNPFIGDRNHFHHLLQQKKFKLNSILIIFTLFTAMPILINSFTIINPIVIILSFIILYSCFVFYLKKKVTN